MGFKLTQKAKRHFRPLFIDNKGKAVRDPILERTLEHIADRTFQNENVPHPVKESGSEISHKGLADQLGHTENVIRGRVETLLAMGILVEEGRTTKGVRRLGVDLTQMAHFNENPFTPLGQGGHPLSGRGQIDPIDPIDPSIITSPSSIQSEPPALANPTNYPHAEEEKPLQNEVQEGREDEEVTTSFTETQSPTDIPSSLQAGNLYADQIEADSVSPEELARRRLASLNLPWTPPVAPYMIALNNYPHIDMDMLIVDYIDWSGRNDVKRTVNGWNNFIRTEHERQMRVEGNAAREERQKRNWIRKHFGADY